MNLNFFVPHSTHLPASADLLFLVVIVVTSFEPTSKSCEGWRRSFSELIVLQKEQGLNESKIEQSLAGQPIQPQKKRYRDAASIIKKIVETYKEIDLMDYLRGLSHNFSF
ncbi:hypothetical protein ACJMK2_036570 [Sinanodonta woodiana]|uniref:Uncharacterized protein n=1 Tax=Sinanodonta woodiana TaxID=1069815 RepID=A0ABD3WHL9_SINWO